MEFWSVQDDYNLKSAGGGKLGNLLDPIKSLTFTPSFLNIGQNFGNEPRKVPKNKAEFNSHEGLGARRRRVFVVFFLRHKLESGEDFIVYGRRRTGGMGRLAAVSRSVRRKENEINA